MKKRSIFILIGLLVFCAEALPQIKQVSNVSEGNEEIPPAENNIQHKDLLKDKVLDVNNEKAKGFLRYREQMTSTLRETLNRQESRDEFKFNPIKSLNGNLKFGGFYNGGVDLFVAPDMYIKPFEGISIYAIRKKHVFIRLEKMQENIRPLLIETLCLAAIENAVNYLTVGNRVLNGILNFALKNGFTFISQATKDKNKKLPTWESYYFSIGVRF